MYKIWVDMQSGEWGLVIDLRILDVEWWDEFEKLFNESHDLERIRIAKAFGKQMK